MLEKGQNYGVISKRKIVLRYKKGLISKAQYEELITLPAHIVYCVPTKFNEHRNVVIIGKDKMLHFDYVQKLNHSPKEISEFFEVILKNTKNLTRNGRFNGMCGLIESFRHSEKIYSDLENILCHRKEWYHALYMNLFDSEFYYPRGWKWPRRIWLKKIIKEFAA